MEKKPKKPIYKRWWFWLIVIIVVAGAAGGKNNDADLDKRQAPSGTIATDTPAKQIETPTAAPTVEPTVEPAKEPASNQGGVDKASLDAACSLIEMTLKDNFSGYSVSHDDENMITVNVWSDGIASELVAAQLTDNQNAKESWKTVRENMVSLSESVGGLVDTLELDGVYVLLNVLNDQNLDNTLLSITEDIVIYDAMPD